MVMDANKTYLIDLDGTMYRGNQIIEEAIAFINYLQKEKIDYLFVTNNAMRTPKQICHKMEQMGFQHLRESDFFTSAMAAVAYMKKTSDAQYAFMIGEAGLAEALSEGGYILDETKAELVFVGLDRQADFALYCKAMRILYENHALLVGTNADRRLPDNDSYLIGNGAILEMLAYASQAQMLMIGKPSAYMMEETLAYVHKKATDCVVIGDNLETDIAFGKDNGVATIMVCSGVHSKEDAKAFRVQPDLVVTSLSELIIK